MGAEVGELRNLHHELYTDQDEGPGVVSLPLMMASNSKSPQTEQIRALDLAAVVHPTTNCL